MPEVRLEADVCVVGGGMAGVCAALAAARHGASTVIIQDRPVFGGNASSEIRMHVCGADARNNIWRETGILEELRLEALCNNPHHNPHQMDQILYNAVRNQPNLRAFVNAQVTGCKVVRKRVISCEARELTSDRTVRVSAGQFIDCTGDGALAFAAGAEYRHGREGRDEFDESLAPEKPDNYTLGHSILFQATDMGKPTPYTPPRWALKFDSDEQLPYRGHVSPSGYWWIEWGGTMDTITDTEAIKEELIAAALGLWDHMKNRGDHGFANYALTWLGFIPGRRESRRFVGDVMLTQNHLQEGHQWPEQVAYGGWPIDTHPPLGFRSPERPCDQTELQKPYGIPLWACYCRGFTNLYVAGRHISASHIAFASTRIMATCAVIGQAVGTSAAIAARRGATAQEMAENHAQELQQALLADGAYLLDVKNSDPSDLARTAAITASSLESAEFRPELVADGYNHPDAVSSHAWHSDPGKGLPAWLELRWKDPVGIGHVRLVLDTDFSSKMMLTQEPRLQAQIKPVPREVTLKDMRVETLSDNGMWHAAASVKGNYQRLVTLDFEPVNTRAVRITADATWGADYASIIEVRCT